MHYNKHLLKSTVDIFFHELCVMKYLSLQLCLYSLVYMCNGYRWGFLNSIYRINENIIIRSDHHRRQSIWQTAGCSAEQSSSTTTLSGVVERIVQPFPPPDFWILGALWKGIFKSRGTSHLVHLVNCANWCDPAGSIWEWSCLPSKASQSRYQDCCRRKWRTSWGKCPPSVAGRWFLHIFYSYKCKKYSGSVADSLL